MEHVVFYPSAEGAPSFRRVSSREEAVNFVEHLRNAEGITEFSVHALTPVPLAVRAYYRVEASPAETAAVSPVPVQATAPQPTPPADEDRAAEWVAAATVVEPPAPEIPAPTHAEAPPAPAFAVPAAAAPAASTPFAEAPPVEAPAAAATEEQAAPVSADVLPEADEAAVAPAGRRSMGFFTR
jgi:hypothetical protein